MLASIVWWLAVPSASAAGYFYPDSGIVANGRGGAFVAGANNQFAQYYNPAGLIRMKYPTLNVGLSGVKQYVDFDRAPAADGTTFDRVQNQGQWFSIPEIGFATPLSDKFAMAVGITSGFAPDFAYPADGPQRYSMIDAGIYAFSIGPSFAYRPIPQVTVGVGLEWEVLQVQERLKVTTTGLDAPGGDVLVDAAVKDNFTPSYNLGLLIEPVEQVSIGVSYQPPIAFEGRGTGLLDFTGNALEPLLRQSQWTDDDIGMALQMPMFIRSGVAVRPIEGLEIEGDFVYEGWSALQDIVVNDIDVEVQGGCNSEGQNCMITQPVQDSLALPAGFRDAWSVRLGAEYAFEHVDVRAGGMYETASLTPQQVSVAVVDTPKFQLGTGTSVHLLNNRLIVDAYASTVKFQHLTITDSQVSQINVFDPTKFQTVGNGNLRSLGVAFGLGLRWQFTGGEKG